MTESAEWISQVEKIININLSTNSMSRLCIRIWESFTHSFCVLITFNLEFNFVSLGVSRQTRERKRDSMSKNKFVMNVCAKRRKALRCKTKSIEVKNQKFQSCKVVKSKPTELINFWYFIRDRKISQPCMTMPHRAGFCDRRKKTKYFWVNKLWTEWWWSHQLTDALHHHEFA